MESLWGFLLVAPLLKTSFGPKTAALGGSASFQERHHTAWAEWVWDGLDAKTPRLDKRSNTVNTVHTLHRSVSQNCGPFVGSSCARDFSTWGTSYARWALIDTWNRVTLQALASRCWFWVKHESLIVRKKQHYDCSRKHSFYQKRDYKQEVSIHAFHATTRQVPPDAAMTNVS